MWNRWTSHNFCFRKSREQCANTEKFLWVSGFVRRVLHGNRKHGTIWVLELFLLTSYIIVLLQIWIIISFFPNTIYAHFTTSGVCICRNNGSFMKRKNVFLTSCLIFRQPEISFRLSSQASWVRYCLHCRVASVKPFFFIRWRFS